jgi:hypothetical protein
MKTMEKAKFKAQKITSKAHSEQFILMLGFKMLQKEDAQKFVTCLFSHGFKFGAELAASWYSGEPPGLDRVPWLCQSIWEHS